MKQEVTETGYCFMDFWVFVQGVSDIKLEAEVNMTLRVIQYAF